MDDTIEDLVDWLQAFDYHTRKNNLEIMQRINEKAGGHLSCAIEHVREAIKELNAQRKRLKRMEKTIKWATENDIEVMGEILFTDDKEDSHT